MGSNSSQSPPSKNLRSHSHRDQSSPARKKHSTTGNNSRAKSPKKRELSPSLASPPRHRSSQKEDRRSPIGKEQRNSSRARSPKREKSRSPSPRTKRLRRAQVEKEKEGDYIMRDREIERNHHHGKEGSDKGSSRREREVEIKDARSNHREREIGKERSSRRDEIEGRSSHSSRGRHGLSSTSPSEAERRYRSKQPRSHSPPQSRDRDEGTNSRGAERRNNDDDRDDDSVAKMKAAEDALEAKQKQKPSFELSGKLAAETNRVRGVTLLFTEPPDAREPTVRWRLYVFKGGEVLKEPLYIHRQSCYLFGRERRVADIPTDHPSCSKQHAVIQFRQVEKEQPDGMLTKEVRPYIMDLGSTNKTFINDNPIEPQRYYELFEKDTIKFGNSSREYVLLHENSAG